MSERMTEPFEESAHVAVTDFFFGPQPAWGPLPFRSDAIDIERWRPRLLSSMWSSVSDALLAERPTARWYAEKLAVDEAPLRKAGVELFAIDLIRDPRDVLASRRAFMAEGTEWWERDAASVAAELEQRLDELDATPADLRLRYEDLACDLQRTAQELADRLDIELDPDEVERPAHHLTTSSATASVGRWRNDLDPTDAALITPLAERLGY
jgi:hypothetical protein